MSLLSQVRVRLQALVCRTRAERELAEELRVHVDMETEANLARGFDIEEARRRALLAVGGVERVKEEVRDARSWGLLEDMVVDLRYAVRRLRREPGFSVPVIATLSLGIGVTVAVFGLANAVLLRPLPYPEADRLVAIRHTASKAELPMGGITPGLADYYRANSRVFEDVGLYIEHVGTLTDLDRAERVDWAFATPGFFSVLGAKARLGRLTIPADYEPPALDRNGEVRSVVISHALWTRRYGADPGVIGRSIEVDGHKQTVVGVTEPGFQFPRPETDIWFAFGWGADQAARASLQALGYSGIARLKPGVSEAEAQRDLDRLTRALPDRFPDVTVHQLEDMGFRAVPVPLKREIIGSVREAVLLLAATAAFLLLITWANATNLTLVRAERLRREVAVARALGAGAGHLARRFVSESLVLAGVGGAIGLALAAVAIRVRFGFAPDDIPRLREVTVDGAVLGLAVGLALASGALLGAVALVSGGQPRLITALTGAGGRMTSGRREQLGRRVLVTAQVALALMLLIASALMAQSFWRLKQVKLGFDPDGAVVFRLSVPGMGRGPNYFDGVARVHDEVLRRLRALPGVQAADAASTSAFPLTPVPAYYYRALAMAGAASAPPGGWPYGLLSFATPGYFQTMGIPLLRGRTFRWEDTGRVGYGVILSASLAKALFSDVDPIGRRVRWARPSRDPDYTVVGVAGDVPSEALRDGPSKAFYFPNLYPPKADTITGVVHDYIPDDEFYVVRTRLPLAAIFPSMQRIVHEVDARLAITQAGTLDKVVADSMARARLTMLLLIVAAMTALALGVIGIYGVLAYSVSRRANEMGIRIALGANPGAVVGMVVRQGTALAMTGVVAGLLAAFALTRYLRSLLYEVSPTQPLAFASMAALLLLVGAAASYLPARRAGRIDPVQALRRE